MNRFESDDTFSRGMRKSLQGILSLFESTSGTFLSYRARPRKSNDVLPRGEPAKNFPLFAIVVQGPLMDKFDFTLETLRLYRRIFPNAQLILSTWKGANPRTIDACKSLEVDVVMSDLPADPGQQHFNYQLVSSRVGIERAARLGARYVLKSRSDQRVHAPDLQAILMNLLLAFPLKMAGRQRERIVSASLGAYRYRMYGMTDMLLFGQIDDMLLYWSAPLSAVRATPRTGPVSLRDLASERVCEVNLATEFLSAVGRQQAWTLADSWHAFADHFCVIDSASLDLYWPKYARFNEQRFGAYSKHLSTEPMTFMDWLQCYTGSIFSTEIPEWILDVAGPVLQS